ncbi:outer membrane assembly lipoprotein YfiO [Oleidesulfovibrio alaskensis G20]|uniref:Outer membrane assembly lipoprotein YfiO n=1 Tax=Oleidesulfovibrio alaskensis (strain ATCC BAA-1058 / DSM 17464 / G20) TaxID=207559 RepID=Q30ZN4_OLEA2|nr:outer membrane protein assembly factor BamD [Oleidesulfovibrio alaskensis]ABB38862.1 outer membrane assembly lipoprotein YfiO [Oleidesulfovibrio alaskensis G20]MBG0772347.1 outer membrane protein assembly factor BamD [Oleidesulfovibrio alaskensis]
MRRTIVRFMVMLSLLATLSGCGIIDYFFLPPPEDTAQELFESGNDAMREKDYASATDYFSKLKDNFPFSPYAIEAELSLGDAYFLDEEYAMAAEAYKEFETLHPRHKAIPYVLFQIGNANLKSFVSIDRPQTNVAEAYEYFSRVRESYPGSEYAQKAGELLGECRRLMAEHELFVADFYWRTGKFRSAASRYQHVAQEFPDVEDLRAYAEEKGKIAYLRATEEKAQQDRDRRHGSWKQWFEWL